MSHGDPAASHRVREDFDAIARLSDTHPHRDRHEDEVAEHVPAGARAILDVGCGLGALAARLAAPGRTVTGIDLSPEMIARASRLVAGRPGLDFRCGDFLTMDLPAGGYDCVISAATLHHMPADAAVARMVWLLAPGGTLVIQDLRRDQGLGDRLGTVADLAARALERLVRTGRLREPRPVREAWARHGAGERYLSMAEVRTLAARRLPGARVRRHRYWRYSIVWQNPPLGLGADRARGVGEAMEERGAR
jgi:SAM-dependent methyltransferase